MAEKETPEEEETKEIEVNEKKAKRRETSRGVIYTVIAIAFLAIGFLVGGVMQVPTGQVTGTGDIISADDAGDAALDYINTNMVQAGTQASLASVEEESGLYVVSISLNNNIIPVYVTMDGKYLIILGVPNIPGIIDMTEPVERPEQPTGVPKSDKPEVELYIFSYCPAGSSALDSFSEAADLLKDVAGFKVKFFSHMHGEYERQENMIMECIQKVAPDKFWDYAKQFLEQVYQQCASSRSTDCDKEKAIALMNTIGIDSDAVMACVENDGETLYQSDIADATSLKLSYSPSVVINGVYLGSVDRSPEGIKSAVCSAFNTPPEECSQTLSTTGSQAGEQC